ncbi:hypothetical protein [Xanthomonas phage JGB6]|nr:hypothetical protein [Xanthomonas phage JGB6]
MEQLIANGELTSKGLTEHFQKVKYSIGTLARSRTRSCSCSRPQGG